jgi:hypothetical protein
LTFYEERYRLTSRAAVGLAASVFLVLVGFLWHLPVIFLPLGAGLAVLTAQGAGVIDRVRRTTAFRADQAGITLGTVPDRLTPRRGHGGGGTGRSDPRHEYRSPSQRRGRRPAEQHAGGGPRRVAGAEA